jgi:hypothetical protein
MDKKENRKNPIAWRYCTKCGKVIELDYYPFNRTIPEELLILEEEHSLHLCNSCANLFATCNAKKIVFGCCIGNDNVLECNEYLRKGEEGEKII